MKGLWVAMILTVVCLAMPTFISASERSSRLERVMVKSDDALLFCQVIGEGDPIVVIHGGPGLSQDYLLPYMARLGEKNRVIFYDQRGCGSSTGQISEDSITLRRFVDDIEAIRKAFGYRKITVLGHSWGGMLAMEYAIAYPHSLERLILVASAPASSEEFRKCEKEWLSRMAPYQEELKQMTETRAFAEGDSEIVEKYFKRTFCLYFYDSKKAGLIQWKLSGRAFLAGMRVHELLQKSLLSSYDLHPSLSKLKVPTFILHGENDPILPSTAQKIHESIPGSSCHIIPHCAHFPYVESPELFFDHVFAIMKEKETSRR